MVDVFAGLSAFKLALDTAKGLKGISDAVARNEAVIDLQGQILTAQENYAALLDEVRDLKEKVASFEKWEAEKQRYELKKLGGGSFAYMLKPAERGATPPHFVCANCYERGQKSIIQFARPSPANSMSWTCPSCSKTIVPSLQVLPAGNVTWLD